MLGGVWLEGLGWLRLDLLGRLLLAATLGGLIGLEREVSGKPAGFRTNLLICVGAALLTELSVAIARAANPLDTSADPTRIAAQIVSGIGFLGAGTIIRARGSVVGLTTAATLWVVAAIGMAVGARAYIEAVGTTLLVIVALILLGRVEDALLRRRAERRIQVVVDPDTELVRRVSEALGRAGFSVDVVDIQRSEDGFVASLRVSGPRPKWDEILPGLFAMPGVRRVSYL
ncbi:MAG TPA: MgtC/SapB family protein [Longimicrobiales bacterium]